MFLSQRINPLSFLALITPLQAFHLFPQHPVLIIDLPQLRLIPVEIILYGLLTVYQGETLLLLVLEGCYETVVLGLLVLELGACRVVFYLLDL